MTADGPELTGLLPGDVCVAGCVRAGPVPALLDAEAAALGQVCATRRADFALGRACAHRAISALGLPVSPLLPGPGGSPRWPDGAVGSLTHGGRYCAGAVARRRTYLGLGIDAEDHEALPPRVRARVTLPAERAWLRAAPAGVHWDRILFSAKESVYKAWHPLTGRWLGFRDATTSWTVEAVRPGGYACGAFRALLLVRPPSVDGCRLTELRGRFVVDDEVVLTAVTVPQRNAR